MRGCGDGRRRLACRGAHALPRPYGRHPHRRCEPGTAPAAAGVPLLQHHRVGGVPRHHRLGLRRGRRTRRQRRVGRPARPDRPPRSRRRALVQPDRPSSRPLHDVRRPVPRPDRAGPGPGLRPAPGHRGDLGGRLRRDLGDPAGPLCAAPGPRRHHRAADRLQLPLGCGRGSGGLHRPLGRRPADGAVGAGRRGARGRRPHRRRGTAGTAAHGAGAELRPRGTAHDGASRGESCSTTRPPGCSRPPRSPSTSSSAPSTSCSSCWPSTCSGSRCRARASSTPRSGWAPSSGRP